MNIGMAVSHHCRRPVFNYGICKIPDSPRMTGKPEVGPSRTTRAVFGLKLARLGRKGFQVSAQQIPYSARDCHALLIRSHPRRRVLEALMQPFHRAGKTGAFLCRIANNWMDSPGQLNCAIR